MSDFVEFLNSVAGFATTALGSMVLVMSFAFPAQPCNPPMIINTTGCVDKNIWGGSTFVMDDATATVASLIIAFIVSCVATGLAHKFSVENKGNLFE